MLIRLVTGASWVDIEAILDFGEGTVPTVLRLTESVAYPNGVLQLTYETAGTPTYGSIGG